jgi:hypothetical protein
MRFIRNDSRRHVAVSLSIGLLMTLCVGILPLAAVAKKGEATFTVEVSAGRWKGARIKNIPAGAKLGVEVGVDGPVEVLLLSGEDYARAGVEKALFRGKTSDRLIFSVLAPESGDYYVVIDNRTGSSARSAELTVSGETQQIARNEAQEDARGEALDADARLQLFERRLSVLFEFEPFPIRVGSCPAGALADSTGVVLCEEYLGQLRERLDDKDKIEDVLLFTLFHEIGHVLLRQWSYPTYSNEETADEFATVLIVMLSQEERLEAQAEFFHANASLLEVIAKATSNDRHPLSAQRARNIRHWSQDVDLVRRWQPVLVPRMQTPVLERLLESPTAWTDVALVEKELATRR